MKLYFDSLTTLKVIHAESPIVIFFGTYGSEPVYSFCISDLNLFALHMPWPKRGILIGLGIFLSSR